MRFVRMTCFALVTFFAFTSPAGDALDLTPRQREAFEYLLHATRFEMPAVGFAAAPSHGYIAMRIVARSEHADAAFKELLSGGTNAGQLYGLIGVRHTERAFFIQRIAAFKASTKDVDLFSGCVIGSEKVSMLARQIDGPLYEEAFKEDRDKRVHEAEATFDFKTQP